MKKFILLTFAFLAWGFYEMSGGSDFVPASARVAPVDATVLAVVPAETTTPPVEGDDLPQDEEVETAAVVDTTQELTPLPAEVTRVALNLTSLQEVLGNGQDPAVENADAPQEPIPAPVTAGSSVSSVTTPAVIPSLVAGVDETPQPSLVVAAAPADIRTVSGNRVNVRGGPGTGFGVVSRLVRGDTVEVLEDNGTGWVRMRPVDGDIEGWMADFLLSNG